MWTKTHEGELVNLKNCSAIKREFKPNCRIIAHMDDGSRYTLMACAKPEMLESYYSALMRTLIPQNERWWSYIDAVVAKEEKNERRAPI